MAHQSEEVIREVAAGLGIPLTEITKKVPSFRLGRPTHTNTIFRWILDGVRRQDGSRLYLEACRLGGRWLTTEAALARFIAAQTPSAASVPEPRTTTHRNRSAIRASERLDAIGI